jgi:hypothetical protein
MADAAPICAIYNTYIATTSISFEEEPVTEQDIFHLVIGGIALPNEGSVGLHEHFSFRKLAHFKGGSQITSRVELMAGQAALIIIDMQKGMRTIIPILMPSRPGRPMRATPSSSDATEDGWRSSSRCLTMPAPWRSLHVCVGCRISRMLC